MIPLCTMQGSQPGSLHHLDRQEEVQDTSGYIGKRVYRGNGVKTNVLSTNSDFIPERALIRFNQERGIDSGSLVKVPAAESMSGISITVSNRKPEAGSSKSEMRKRLGSPRGEREKGEVCQEARDTQVDRELQEARDRQDACASVPPRPLELLGEKARTSKRKLLKKPKRSAKDTSSN